MNKVLFYGRIAKITPATRGDKDFCYVTIVHDNGKTKEGKEIPADFVDFQAWNGIAKLLKQYCTVGQFVNVEGHLKKSVYEKDGQKRSEQSIVIDRIELGDKRNASTSAPEKEEIISDESIDVSNDDLPF